MATAIHSEIVFTQHDHTLIVELDENGNIYQIVHEWPSNGERQQAIDDTWHKREQYKNRTPGFVVESYINAGWIKA